MATTITLGAGAARRDYDLTITPLITRGHYRGGVAILRDVTERVRTTARIAFLAEHDPLTGLPNRRTFLARLDDALALAREGTSDPAILFIDLDGFKAVNDTRGHASGDRLLGAVAERMRHCLGPDDLLARLGGDEFTVLLTARRTRRRARSGSRQRSIARSRCRMGMCASPRVSGSPSTRSMVGARPPSSRRPTRRCIR